MSDAITTLQMSRTLEAITNGKSLYASLELARQPTIRDGFFQYVVHTLLRLIHCSETSPDELDKDANLLSKTMITAILNAQVSPMNRVWMCEFSINGCKYLLMSDTNSADITIRDLTHSTQSAKLEGKNLVELKQAIISGMLKAAVRTNGELRLPPANLSGVDLNKFDLRGVVLDRNYLRAAISCGCNLRGARLAGNVDCKGLNFRFIKVDAVMLNQLILAGANIRGIDVSGEDLTDLRLVNLNLKDVNFSNAIMKHCYLTGSLLKGANLSGADCSNAHCVDADLSAAIIDQNTLFTKADLRFAYPHPRFTNDQLIGAKVTLPQAALLGFGAGMEISSIDPPFFSLRNFNFSKARMTGICLNYMDLTNADLSAANLTGIKINGNTILTGVTMNNAILDQIDFRETAPDFNPQIYAASFRGAKLNNAWLEAALDYNARLEGADLSDCDLDDLSQTDFHKLNLREMVLSQQQKTTYLTEVAQQGADVVEVEPLALIIPVVYDFSNLPPYLNPISFNMIEAQLNGYDLRTVEINASAIDITGATLRGSRLTREWVIAAIRYGISLEQTDLSGLDLRGLDLTELDLTGANLAGATLTTTELNFSGLTAAMASREIRDQQGRRIALDLKGVVLKNIEQANVDFSYTDLSNAKFYDCRFEWPDFESANLSGINLGTIKLKGVRGDNIKVRVADIAAYLEVFEKRLNAILNSIRFPEEDVFSNTSLKEILQLRKFVMHHTGYFSLREGMTHSDGGPQNLVLSDYSRQIDSRLVESGLTQAHHERLIDQIKNKLLAQGFTDEQRVLFYWARAAVDLPGKIDILLGLKVGSRISQNEVIKMRFETQTYLQSHIHNKKGSNELYQLCFNMVLKKFLKDFSADALSRRQIEEVREFFCAPHLLW